MAIREFSPARLWERPLFVFVVGTGRCGSTMVEEVLARHRSTDFVSNVEDAFPAIRHTGRWNSALYRALPPALTRKGGFRYAPSEAYRVLDREVSPIMSMPGRDLTAADVTPWLERRFREFFGMRAAAQNKAVFLHKFTGWPRVGFIHRVFPHARFIHIVRDGRAVANSWLQMPWWHGYQGPDHWQWGPLPEAYAREWGEAGRSFPLLAGILWKILIEAFERAAATVPGSAWLELRYEDIVAHPESSFATMLDFCGLGHDASFKRGLGRHTFATSRSDAFRRDLDVSSLDILTRSLRTHLERYGYSL